MNAGNTEVARLMQELVACQLRINELEKSGEEREGMTQMKTRFENLFELSPDAFVIVDRDGTVTRVNRAAEILFGYRRDEMIGMDHGMLVPNALRQRHDTKLREYMDQPRLRVMGIGLDLEGRRKDGSEFPADIDLGPIEIDGRFCVVAVVRDATARRKLEIELLESEEKYRTLFTSMSNGYAFCQIVTDDQNRPVDFLYIEVNDAFEQMTGLRKQSVLGKRVTEATPGVAEQNPEIIQIYGKVALTGEPSQFEVFFESLKAWFAISVYCPKRGYFVALFDNITGRKRMEEELASYRLRLEDVVSQRTGDLARTNERLSQEIDAHRIAEESQALRATILDNARASVFLINTQGNFVYANEAAIGTYGYSREEFLGMNLRQLLRPHEAPLVTERLRIVVMTGRLELETLHVRKDGALVPVEVRHSLIKTVHGHFIVSAVNDVSDRVKFQTMLEQMPGVLWTTDGDLVITSATGRDLEPAGLDASAGVGTALGKYLGEHGINGDIVRAHQSALEGQQSGFHFERSGQVFHGRAAALKNTSGEVVGTIGIAVRSAL